jgi:hypothetical protein
MSQYDYLYIGDLQNKSGKIYVGTKVRIAEEEISLIFDKTMDEKTAKNGTIDIRLIPEISVKDFSLESTIKAVTEYHGSSREDQTYALNDSKKIRIIEVHPHTAGIEVVGKKLGIVTREHILENIAQDSRSFIEKYLTSQNA